MTRDRSIDGSPVYKSIVGALSVLSCDNCSSVNMLFFKLFIVSAVVCASYAQNVFTRTLNGNNRLGQVQNINWLLCVLYFACNINRISVINYMQLNIKQKITHERILAVLLPSLFHTFRTLHISHCHSDRRHQLMLYLIEVFEC